MYKNKVIWITGASSGIGEALAYALAEQGAILILTSRREQALNQVRAQCVDTIKHHVLALDMLEYESAPSWVEQALKLEGRIDILVNNAGVSQRSLAEHTDMSVYETITRLDYLSPVALTRALLPHFIANQDGYFVNISSVAGLLGTSGRTAYCGAKHALLGFSDALRTEIRDRNIFVTTVCPSYVKTNVAINALSGSNQAVGVTDDDIENGIPLAVFIPKLLNAMNKKKPEAIIATGLPRIGVFVRRHFPNWFLPRQHTLTPSKD